MAQLFSNWTIKSSTEVIWWYNQNHALPIVQKLYEDFLKWLMKNETAYEQTFNQLFFVELLGYAPNENIRPKAWTPIGGKIADAALWVFPDGVYITDWVQVAVELKDSTVQLDKKQARTDTSTPVEQWFQYKTSFKNCGWLIVSNFFVTRLYRDNKQDYEEWTLEQLLDPTHDYFQLRKLILLLHKNRLLKSSLSSESFTEKLLSQFRIEQQNITKKFYKEYKDLRFELINDIRTHNINISIETAVEKAQKIIDRIVFIHFCEDRGLLPDGKLKENVYRAAEADFTPWEVLKKFFMWVDSGSQKLWIPHGYNGELFKPDTVLDWLHVWDAICKKFIEIGNYDFAEELSVTILWHIFEQSISDIENLKIDLLWQKTETEHLVEKKESKRKKDGIFYTPEYIVDYIVENSLMKYLSEKEDECLEKVEKRWWYKTELEAYQAYQQILQNIKVVDPACGSGAFLVKVFDRLLQEHERVWEIISRIKWMKVILNLDDVFKNILTNNIYGVDLNAESVEITKLSLWLKSAQKGKKLNNLDKNIKCGNSLIDDPEVAGDKAFSWEKEFADIFAVGGFDVVVGNPPYVSYYSKQSQSDNYTKTVLNELTSKYTFIKDKKKHWRFNTVMFFIEQWVKLLKNDGCISYIIDTNIHSNPFSDIREFLIRQIRIEKIIDEISVFEWVASSQLIFTWVKNNNNDVNTIIREWFQKWLLNYKIWSKLQRDILSLKYNSGEYWEILQKVSKYNTISNIVGKENVRTCITFTGKKEYFIRNQKNSDNIYPLVEWSSGVPYSYSPTISNCYIEYNLDLRDKLNKEYQEQAKKDNKRSPMVIWLWKIEQFSAPKIFIRLSDKKLTATYSSKIECADLSLYIVTLNELSEFNNNISLKYLLAIINSKLLTFYFIKNSYIKNINTWTPQIRLNEIRNIPIKLINFREQNPFIEKVNYILNQNSKLWVEKNTFLTRIKSNLTEKITKKLENFEELSFKDFVAELKKQKINLTLVQQDEREPYFNDYKTRILDLKQQIQQTDTEIDNMVFDLYGLTEEERKIVLDG